MTYADFQKSPLRFSRLAVNVQKKKKKALEVFIFVNWNQL